MKRVPRLALVASLLLAGCATTANQINPGPSAAVAFATERVSPAVVRLDVVTENFSGGQAHAQRAIGSGVIIDKEGHVLTNFHVAGRATRIDITLANLEHVRASLVGSDHWTDLALVKLDPDEIKTRKLTFQWAPLGDSAQVKLGQPVMAIGTPYGLTRTLTAGIISNTDRFFDDSDIDQYETGWFNNWLQTDAAINPGNSGGPLINLRGEVIGINTRGVSSGNNLGFAIPINVAKQVVSEILARKKVERSYVGIQMQPLQDLESYYDLANNNGVLVRSVEPDSPAAQAGVQPEDIITAVNDKPVTVRFPEQLAAVRKFIAEQPLGSPVKLTLLRGSKGNEHSVTLTMKTDLLESAVTEEKSIASWGASVRNVTHAYLRKLKLPVDLKGILVTGLRPGSSAQDAGMREDDIILRVDQKPVTSVDELDATVTTLAKTPKPVAVEVRRDRSEKVLVLKPRE